MPERMVLIKTGPPMEPCSWCGGHGLVMNGEDVADCWRCGGGGMQEKRDEHGRFLPWDTALVTEAQLREWEVIG